MSTDLEKIFNGKKYFCFWLTMILLFVLCFVFSYQKTAAASPQKIIGVLPFSVSNSRNSLGQSATDSLTSALVQSNKFQVVDRMHLTQLLNEQGLRYTGMLDTKNAAQFGRISGLNYIVVGSVTGARVVDHDRVLWNQSIAQVTVSMQVIDTNTGTIVFADTVVGKVEHVRTTDSNGRTMFGDKASSDEYESAVQNAAQQLTEHFINGLTTSVAVVYVAQIDDDRVWLDVRGNKSIVPGQIFTVYREKGKIKSPVSGQFIGTMKIELCQIRIDYVDDSIASGTPINGDISLVGEGDKAIRQ